jgi:hypothetical protein
MPQTAALVPVSDTGNSAPGAARAYVKLTLIHQWTSSDEALSWPYSVRSATLLSKAASDIAVTPSISEEKANKTAATKTIRFIASI